MLHPYTEADRFSIQIVGKAVWLSSHISARSRHSKPVHEEDVQLSPQ